MDFMQYPCNYDNSSSVYNGTGYYINYDLGKSETSNEPDPDEYTKEEKETIRKESIPGNKFAGIFAEISRKKDREDLEKPMPKEILSIKDNGEIVIDIESTDPIDSGRKLYDKRSITLNSNCITPLVGCNGAGKTTMIHIITDIVRRANFPYVKFDNLEDGGGNAISSSAYDHDFTLTATLLTSSEGESIFHNVVPYIQLVNSVIKGKYKRNENLTLYRDTDHIFFFLDATDSGFSIDNIATLKDHLNTLVENSKKYNKHLYIIIAANSFELARNCNCWDVQHSKYIEFGTDYEKYREFIIKSRKRIIKQWQNLEEKSKGEDDNETH